VAGGRPVAAPPLFLDATTGYMGISAGAGPISGTILVTRDGGRSWKGIGEGRDWSIEALVMDSLQDGWAIGRSPAKSNFLLHTENGWTSWQQVLPGLTPVQDVSFLDANRGFGIGTASDPSALVRTEDGGATWTLVDAKLTRPFVAISFVDPSSGWAMAEGLASARQILHTGDGGRTWTQTAALPDDQADGLAPSYPYLRFFSASDGLVEPLEWPQTTVARSRDGGKTWSPQGSLTRKSGSWIKLAFVSPDQGFAAVQNPRQGSGTTGAVTLLKTDDGGRTWANLPALEGDYWVQGLAFLSTDRGFLLVRRDPLSPQPTEELLQTADGGKSWKPLAVSAGGPSPLSEAPSEAIRLLFADDAHGWILTPGGMLATRDGGRTWVALP
ncbi:MAG: WD40/YVTN/BNR-like repeat-containing protein, partial [Bacillota bacterium]